MSDSVPAGASVTLQCSVLSESRAAELQVLWFRAAPPQSHPQIIYTHHNSSHQCESGSSTHTCVYTFTKNILSLNDTGTYYCAVALCGKIVFGNGTPVQLDDRDVKVSVWQHGMSDSVPAGASVTLQCSVLSESRAAELQVLWFRAAPPQSHPQIIYTHHNSSHQCESGSSTHTCVYNFTKNILSLSDTGTYYCAVVLCGKIIFGNGTQIQLENSATSYNPVVVSLATALVMCGILTSVQTVLLCKRKNCQQCKERSLHGAVINTEKTNTQDPDGMELNYAALHFNERKTKRVRGNRGRSQETLRMTSIWTIILFLNTISPAQTLDFSRPSFLSLKSREPVTLKCPFGDNPKTEHVVWFKQIFGEMPQKVGVRSIYNDFKLFTNFKKSGFQLEETDNSISLTIPHIKKEDRGFYFCGKFSWENFILSSGTFLAVEDDRDVTFTVSQRSVSDSVPAGASVTLQCSVLSESRAAELQVLWFRAAPPQSHPQIIYTHHNSSHQCESGSSTHTCVYNFTKNILSLSDTGTYYCAVALCGKIVSGNGTQVQLGSPRLGLLSSPIFLEGPFCLVQAVVQENPEEIVPEDRDVTFTVSQRSVSDSVPAGASVTLQCSVLSESRAAELQVLWFRAAPPQSHPQIIYTHHNSSHQCESGSSTHTCVYNFTKNILSLNDTGTYYCAVVLCGKIIFGNGTRIQLENSGPEVIYVTVVAVCVVVIFTQAFIIYKLRNCDKSRVKPQQDSVVEKPSNLGADTEELTYTSLHFSKKNTKRVTKKREKPQECVYSEVSTAP
ncbi:hypothetical protein KOW79_006996 [Hemibagrus wyckioides]|uniref:Ig-like domain-containing protein n=1 Tax=Hemibagrus wyckioides TaxID=337641 RepID=A0A9D3SLU8_9TELE|nr:hypothetical protein KOW79_006996 [Hemibagrus wyckioides]